MGIEATAQAMTDRRWLAAVATSDAALRQVLHGLPGVDQVGAEARAAGLATRSIKREAKLWALDTAIRMIDLTTLEGADTPARPERSRRALRRRGVPLPRPHRGRQGGAGRERGRARLGGDRLPVRPR